MIHYEQEAFCELAKTRAGSITLSTKPLTAGGIRFARVTLQNISARKPFQLHLQIKNISVKAFSLI